MHDGQALQSGTSHNFGDGFARAFGIQFTDRDNTLQYVHQTSWGMTTRLIGAIIMVHGDDDGLVLPPKVAPTQCVIIPIRQNADGVLEQANALADALKAEGIRVKVDDTDRSPGWKFADQEMRGFPMRIELGPKDLENGTCVLVRRDTREKQTAAIADAAREAKALLDVIQKDMFERARDFRDSHTYEASTYEEFKTTIEEKPGFVKAYWCGDRACEDQIKEDTKATSRCIPMGSEGNDVPEGAACVCCGKAARKLIYWGRAY